MLTLEKAKEYYKNRINFELKYKSNIIEKVFLESEFNKRKHSNLFAYFLYIKEEEQYIGEVHKVSIFYYQNKEDTNKDYCAETFEIIKKGKIDYKEVDESISNIWKYEDELYSTLGKQIANEIDNQVLKELSNIDKIKEPVDLVDYKHYAKQIKIDVIPKDFNKSIEKYKNNINEFVKLISKGKYDTAYFPPFPIIKNHYKPVDWSKYVNMDVTIPGLQIAQDKTNDIKENCQETKENKIKFIQNGDVINCTIDKIELK